MMRTMGEITIGDTNKGVFTIEDYALSFVSGMDKTKREKFKKMLESGAKCGESVANTYMIEYEPFIAEVKRLMKVEV